MLTSYELGSEAVEYIHAEVARGRGLGGALAKLRLRGGRVVTHLPADVRPDDLADFGSGGIASGEETPHLAEFIESYVAAEPPTRICVFEHATAMAGDPWTPDSPFFTVDDDVFLFAQKGLGREDIEKLARESHWYPSIGVLCRLAEGVEVPAVGSPCDRGLLGSLAQGVDHLLIGAYDAEAWLVWSFG